MQQAHVELPLTIMSCTKAAHVLPSAICKAMPGPMTVSLSPPGAITGLLALIVPH